MPKEDPGPVLAPRTRSREPREARSRENNFAEPGLARGPGRRLRPQRGAGSWARPGRDVSVPAPAAPTPGRASGTPAPQRGANPKQEMRKGRCQPPPPFATRAGSPAPTAAATPATAETEALPLTLPLPPRPSRRGPPHHPRSRGLESRRPASTHRAAAAEPHGGWSPQGFLCAQYWRAVDYHSHKAPRPPPRATPLPRWLPVVTQTTFPDRPHGSPALPPETRAELGVRSGSRSGSRSPPPPSAATLPPLPPRELHRPLRSAVEPPVRGHSLRSDALSPPSPPARATPPGSALALRSRPSPQPRAAPLPHPSSCTLAAAAPRPEHGL